MYIVVILSIQTARSGGLCPANESLGNLPISQDLMKPGELQFEGSPITPTPNVRSKSHPYTSVSEYQANWLISGSAKFTSWVCIIPLFVVLYFWFKDPNQFYTSFTLSVCLLCLH